MEIKEPGAAPKMECGKRRGKGKKKKKKKKCCKSGPNRKQCKVTVGGCAPKSHKKPKKKRCTGPVKRPLPKCPTDEFRKAGEEFALDYPLFQRLKETSAKTINVGKLRIDNTAEIINVSARDIPQPECPDAEKPMKLKARFWSKVAKTITLQPKLAPAQS